MQRGVVAVVADPDLRLEEHFVSGNAGSAKTFTNLGLVEIRGCSVDEPVALGEGGFDRIRGLFGWTLKDPEADCGDLDAIV
jgi:hypothetical protein